MERGRANYIVESRPMPLEGSRYLNGLELEVGLSLAGEEWRDGLGQVFYPQTGSVIEGARRFGHPICRRMPPRIAHLLPLRGSPTRHGRAFVLTI